MKKYAYALIAGGLLMGSFAAMADKGVVVHEKSGNSYFYPADEVDYVEFVDNYDSGNSVQLTSNFKNLTKGQTIKATAIVTAQSDRGLILTDNAGSIFYYNNKVDLNKFTIGTVVEASGTIDVYGTGFQLPNNATLNVVGTYNYKYPTPTVYSSAMVETAGKNTNNVTATYVTIEGTLDITTNTAGTTTYYNINIPGCTYQGSCYEPIGTIKSKLVSGNTYKYTGYFTGITSGKFFYMVLTDVQSADGSSSGNDGDEVPAGYTYPLSYVKLPAGTPQQVKEYTGFTVNFNKDNHTPNYVAWELLSSETSGSYDSGDYWVDSSVEGCLSDDYAYSTYKLDRGHMCPKADSKWSAAARKDCMVMTNMIPQPNSFNGGLWATLEGKERAWASSKGAIWIISGPIYYDTDTQYIGGAKARVPSACFKAFLYENGKDSQAIAYIMANDNATKGNYNDYAVTIDELEKQTGYDFFSTLPDDIENAIEAKFDKSFWN